MDCEWPSLCCPNWRHPSKNFPFWVGKLSILFLLEEYARSYNRKDGALMGNRKQPFGYRVVMGEIALHPQESKLVEYIFQQYLAGATYNTLVEELREQSIPYDEGKLCLQRHCL